MSRVDHAQANCSSARSIGIGGPPGPSFRASHLTALISYGPAAGLGAVGLTFAFGEQRWRSNHRCSVFPLNSRGVTSQTMIDLNLPERRIADESVFSINSLPLDLIRQRGNLQPERCCAVHYCRGRCENARKKKQVSIAENGPNENLGTGSE